MQVTNFVSKQYHQFIDSYKDILVGDYRFNDFYDKEKAGVDLALFIIKLFH